MIVDESAWQLVIKWKGALQPSGRLLSTTIDYHEEFEQAKNEW